MKEVILKVKDIPAEQLAKIKEEWLKMINMKRIGPMILWSNDIEWIELQTHSK